MSNAMNYLNHLCDAQDRGAVVQNILAQQGHHVVKQNIHKGYNLIVHFGQPWVRVFGAHFDKVVVAATLSGWLGLWVRVFGAHFDKVSAGEGANDNGAAVAQLLALAGRLQAAQYTGPLTIVFFDQEEQLGMGAVEEMGSYALGEHLAFQEHYPDIFMVFDVTGIGDTLVLSDVPELTSMVHPQTRKMAEWLKTAVLGHPVAHTPTPPSDNYALRQHGIPSLLLTVLPASLDTRGVWDRIHSSKDNRESIQESAMMFMDSVLDALAHAELPALAKKENC